MAKMIAGKVLYAVVCLAAALLLVVSGYAHKEVGFATDLEKGIAINGGSSSFGSNPGPTAPAENILVMGLESRTNYQGQTLPQSLLTAMHAGSASSVDAGELGSQDTNTLILIHIFAGGKKAVGFSISRDDLVTYPQAYDGQTEGKIDGAYAYAYVQYLNQHAGTESNANLYLYANRAGQAATIATVQAVTGQTIDHFVEVNLAGFYYLAQAFGGIEVCVEPAPAQGGFPAGANLTDEDTLVYPPTDNSGFNAYLDGYSKKKGGAQYLHLSAPQALAFVRSRDTLPGVDLGRTKRQQATIDYVIYELKHEGAFTELGKLNSLLGTASQYLITDSTFNLLDFATEMHALNGQDLSFETLPYTPENGVDVPGYPDPQDVNIIDVPAIQKLVQDTFNPPAAPVAPGAETTSPTASASPSVSVPAPSTVTVDVYNGNPDAIGLAGQTSHALVALGYKAGAVANSDAQSQTVQAGTQVFYGAGMAASAQQLADEFGTTASALSALAAGHVEVLIGSAVSQVPAGLTASATASASTQSVGAQLIGALSAVAGASPTSSPTASATSGIGSSGTGGTVKVAANAPYGIPCVY